MPEFPCSPFHLINTGLTYLCFLFQMQLTAKLVLKEWQFSDGSNSIHTLQPGSRHSSNGSSANFLPTTGRKIYVTVVEGRNLVLKERFGKSDPYVKLQYGKVLIDSCSVLLKCASCMNNHHLPVA